MTQQPNQHPEKAAQSQNPRTEQLVTIEEAQEWAKCGIPTDLVVSWINERANVLISALRFSASTIEAELLKCPESSYVPLSEALLKIGAAIAEISATQEAAQ